MSPNDVGIYLGDEPFSSDIGILYLHPSKGTHWVVYINENFIPSYGCAPSKKLPIFKKNKHRRCICCDYQIQEKNGLRASYVSYIIYSTKVLEIDFKSAVLNLYYQMI